MENCGPRFRQEVGKFKFLNELIKLVSKKHMGDVTPKELQTKILDILFTWTSKYPKEVKIKEAYDMLKTQGIIHEPIKNVLPNNPTSMTRNVSATLETRPKTMDVREMTLRKLLNSKNPKDIQQANLLIQNIVREDERHAQIKIRRSLEMKKVSENVTLLAEMLENYDKNATSSDELALINELYESCELFMPMISKLATDTDQNRDELASILETNDQLVSVLERYSQIVVGNKKIHEAPRPKVPTTGLDDILGLNLMETNQNISKDNVMKELGDIFSKPIEEPSRSSQNPLKPTPDLILQPDKVSPTSVKAPVNPMQKVPENRDSKYAALLNLDPKQTPHSTPSQETNLPKSMQLDLDSLVLGMKSKLLPQENGRTPETDETKKTEKMDKVETKDDSLLDTKSNKSNDDDDAILSDDVPLTIISAVPAAESRDTLKPLTEINIDLDNVEQSSEPPRTVLDEKNGLKVMLNFAKDRPRPDTIVIVISIINQGTTDVSNFTFDASVKKPAKLRLCPASGTSLKGVKPFRPPADGIMQVLLLSNPTAKPLNMICILSYCVDDDPDPVKESIEVKDLPYVCN